MTRRKNGGATESISSLNNQIKSSRKSLLEGNTVRSEISDLLVKEKNAWNAVINAYKAAYAYKAASAYEYKDDRDKDDRDKDDRDIQNKITKFIEDFHKVEDNYTDVIKKTGAFKENTWETRWKTIANAMPPNTRGGEWANFFKSKATLNAEKKAKNDKQAAMKANQQARENAEKAKKKAKKDAIMKNIDTTMNAWKDIITQIRNKKTNLFRYEKNNTRIKQLEAQRNEIIKKQPSVAPPIAPPIASTN